MLNNVKHHSKKAFPATTISPGRPPLVPLDIAGTVAKQAGWYQDPLGRCFSQRAQQDSVWPSVPHFKPSVAGDWPPSAPPKEIELSRFIPTPETWYVSILFNVRTIISRYFKQDVHVLPAALKVLRPPLLTSCWHCILVRGRLFQGCCHSSGSSTSKGLQKFGNNWSQSRNGGKIWINMVEWWNPVGFLGCTKYYMSRQAHMTIMSTTQEHQDVLYSVHLLACRRDTWDAAGYMKSGSTGCC